MEPEGSLPHSQASATCPYPGPAQFSPHTHIRRPEDPSNIIHPSTNRSPQCLFPSGFLSKTLYAPSPHPYEQDIHDYKISSNHALSFKNTGGV